MNLALGIIVVVVTAASAVLVFALFIWGAIKDGQANDAARARVLRRRWAR